jgi:hypothetical protein
MAGQATSQRPQSDSEKAAEHAAIAHFGGRMAEIEAGKYSTAFKRGYAHASKGITAHYGQCQRYDLGFEAHRKISTIT